MTSMPERSAVRYVADFDRAVSTPVRTSTSSIVQVVLLHQANRQHHPEHAEAVGDEPGNVLRDDDALAEHAVAERARRGERLLRRVRRRE